MVQVIVVVLVTAQFCSEMPEGAVPNSALAPFAKLVPVIVTLVPPVVEPLPGVIPVTVGAVVGMPLILKPTTCMTQAPDTPAVA